MSAFSRTNHRIDGRTNFLPKNEWPLPKKCELSIKIQQIKKEQEYQLIWKHKLLKLTYQGIWIEPLSFSKLKHETNLCRVKPFNFVLSSLPLKDTWAYFHVFSKISSYDDFKAKMRVIFWNRQNQISMFWFYLSKKTW